MRRSKMGMKMMRLRGLMFCMMSFGMPWSCIVPAIYVLFLFLGDRKKRKRKVRVFLEESERERKGEGGFFFLFQKEKGGKKWGSGGGRT